MDILIIRLRLGSTLIIRERVSRFLACTGLEIPNMSLIGVFPVNRYQTENDRKKTAFHLKWAYKFRALLSDPSALVLIIMFRLRRVWAIKISADQIPQFI